MKHLFFALAALLLLAACNPEKRLHRKAERRIAQAIALDPRVLLGSQFTDTVLVHDTLVVPGYWVADTLVLTAYDTVYMDTGRLHVEVVRVPGERVFVRGACAPDTVYKAVPVEVKGECPPQVELVQGEPCDDGLPWWVELMLCIIIAGLIARTYMAAPRNR